MFLLVQYMHKSRNDCVDFSICDESDGANHDCDNVFSDEFS